MHSKEIKQIVKKMVDKGFSLSEIEEITNVSERTIQYWIKDNFSDTNNFETRKSSKTKTDLKEQALELYRNDPTLNQTDIAKKLGVASITISRYFKENGIETDRAKKLKVSRKR